MTTNFQSSVSAETELAIIIISDSTRPRSFWWQNVFWSYWHDLIYIVLYYTQAQTINVNIIMRLPTPVVYPEAGVFRVLQHPLCSSQHRKQTATLVALTEKKRAIQMGGGWSCQLIGNAAASTSNNSNLSTPSFPPPPPPPPPTQVLDVLLNSLYC